MKKSFFLALGGILSAFIIIILYISGLVPTSRLTLLVIVSFVGGVAVIELGAKRSIAVYTVVFLLGWMLVPAKLIWILYVLFFGQYPIIAGFTSEVKNKIMSLVIRLVHFNLMYFIGYYVCKYAISMIWNDGFFQKMQSFYTNLSGSYGVYSVIFVVFAGNILFLIYDRIYLLIMNRYKEKISPLLRKIR